MKQCGYHSRVSNTVKPKELEKEYDLDHEITAAIAEVDNIIESCDLGHMFESSHNESLLIKACINHLLEKL
mgnify:CR=1 FL=1